LRQRLAFLHNRHEDIAYLKKQLLEQNGTMPNSVDEQDFFSFLEALNAKPEDKRIWRDPKADAEKFM